MYGQKSGRSEDMEKGHGTTVNRFLDKLSITKILDFLILVVEMVGLLEKCLNIPFASKQLELIKAR